MAAILLGIDISCAKSSVFTKTMLSRCRDAIQQVKAYMRTLHGC